MGKTNLSFCKMIGGYFPVSCSRLILQRSDGRGWVMVAGLAGGPVPCSSPEEDRRRDLISGRVELPSTYLAMRF